jgi:hypothetical protein
MVGLDGIRTRDNNIESVMSYHLTTNPKPNVSIALTSIDYKTIALLLC